MDIVIIILGIWAIIQVCIAVWGLGLLNNNCQNLSLYTRLRTYLVMSAVAATIYFAVLMCNEFCHKGTEETSGLTVIITMVVSLTCFILSLMVKGDIDDCASNTDNYKMVLSYAGALPSFIAFAYSIRMAFVWFSEFKKSRAAKNKLRDVNIKLAQARVEKEKEEKEEAARSKAAEKQKELERLAEEKQAKQKLKEEESKRKIEQDREKAAEAKRQADEAERKREGRFTPEERIARAKEQAKRKLIEEAKAELQSVQDEINSTDEDKVLSLGLDRKFAEAREKLRKAEAGESVQTRSSGWQFLQ